MNGKQQHLELLIQAWHDGAGMGLELYEYLCWTWEEYAHWVTFDEMPDRPLPSLPKPGEVGSAGHELLRTCPSCGDTVEGEPHDIGSGPEFCCSRCDWCWGALGQELDPNDSRRIPAVLLNELPEWARPSFEAA